MRKYFNRAVCRSALVLSVFGACASDAAIVQNWDLLSTGPAPVSAGVPYSLGDGWSAKASTGYAGQGTYYTVGAPANGYQTPNSGANFVYSSEGSSSRDNGTISMIVLSPFFTIDQASPVISAKLVGGRNGSTAPTSISGIGDTLAASGSGWQGIVLLDDSGNVLQAVQHGSNSQTWQTVSFNTASLVANTSYQIALIDTCQGGWGWIAMDDVTIGGTAIPEPGTLGVVSVSGLLALRRRRRRV